MLKPNLLQSREWQHFSELEGHQTFLIEEPTFEYLAILHSAPLGNYLYCPYGPTLDTKSPNDSLELALASLKSLAQKHNAFFIRIEPTYPFPAKQLTSLGLVKSHDLDPAHTWVLDLTQPESDLIAGIEKNKYRHWRIHEKKGITIRTSQDPADITILTNLLQAVSQRNKFNPQDENHLQNQLKSGFATLYIAELDHQPIAASLIYDHEGTRFYAHAAADDAHRKLAPGTSLLVQMILDAKHNGAHTFDFWGITTSEDPQHPWYGFTQYKKSFGGHQVDYAGTWDLPLHRVKYRLYQLLRRVNRFRRHK